jgi:hypothetical protein
LKANNTRIPSLVLREIIIFVVFQWPAASSADSACAFRDLQRRARDRQSGDEMMRAVARVTLL